MMYKANKNELEKSYIRLWMKISFWYLNDFDWLLFANKRVRRYMLEKCNIMLT